MQKPARSLFTAFFIAAAAFLIAGKTPDRYNGPVMVLFSNFPKEKLCVGDKIQIMISYGWNYDNDLGLALIPYIPVKNKKTRPPGQLTMAWSISGEKATHDAYESGMIVSDYTAKIMGTEYLTVTLDYGTAKRTVVSPPFEIVDCSYKLSIKAVHVRKESESSWWNMFSAEGPLEIRADGSVSAQYTMEFWLEYISDEKVLSCKVDPTVTAVSTMVVNGNRYTDKSGVGMLQLIFIFGQMPAFPEAKTECVNNVTKKALPAIDFPLPKDDMTKYLKEQVTFNLPLTPGKPQFVDGTYSLDNESGNSWYILETRKKSS